MTHMRRGLSATHTLLKLELHIVVNGSEDSEMATVSNNGLMAPDMRDNGKTTEPMAKENSRILMVISMRVIGSMIRLMAMESIII